MATEYFFRKLTDGERIYSLDSTFRALLRKMPECVTASDELADVFFYLLPLMTPEQRTQEVFTLSRFLGWLWPDLLSENAHNFWSLIPPHRYDNLYIEIFHLLENSDSGLRKVFPKLFEQSPLDFKKRFVERECENYYLLRLFLKSDDSESIRSILRNLDAADLERLAFRGINRCRIFALFSESILEFEWQGVEVFLREFKLPEGAGVTLRTLYMDTIFKVNHLHFNEDQKRKFKRFFEYFDGTGANAEEVKRVEEIKRAEKHKLKNCHVRIKRLCPGLGDVERPEV